MEISQSVSYFIYFLEEKKDWQPSEDFSHLINFEDHSIFYIKKTKLQHVMDVWRKAKATEYIDFKESYIKIKEAIYIIFRSSVAERVLLKYGERGYRLILQEVGFAYQTNSTTTTHYHWKEKYMFSFIWYIHLILCGVVIVLLLSSNFLNHYN